MISAMNLYNERSASVTKETQVIAVGNQKGGVGKTTTTVHIAAALGEMGKKVLVIDLDSNCGATRGIGLGETWEGTYEMLMGVAEPNEFIVSDDPEVSPLPKNVDVLAARRNLEDFEDDFRRQKKFSDATESLTDPLNKLRGQYDIVLLDTAPHATALTVAAYRTADWFLLVTDTGDLSLRGLNDALRDIRTAREEVNPNLKLLGVVVNRVRMSTSISRAAIVRVRSEFQGHGDMFEEIINQATAIEKAQAAGQTMFEWDPANKATQEYRLLSKAILNRIKNAGKTNENEFEQTEEQEEVNRAEAS